MWRARVLSTSLVSMFGMLGVVPLAERWNGTAWSIQESPSPTGATQSVLEGVSCTSSTACTATGYFINSSEKIVPLAESWNGTAWSVQEPPSPTGAKASYLDHVSCISSTACIATGDFYNSADKIMPLAGSWNGTAWSIQEPSTPTGTTQSAFLGVSCTSSTVCIATGYFKNSAGKELPLAESWNGTAWSIQEPPIPTGATASHLSGVSCASSTACTSVGQFTNSSGKEVPLAEIWNGTAWSIQEPSSPTEAKANGLIGVSCTSSTACTAVGWFTNSEGKERPLAELYH